MKRLLVSTCALAAISVAAPASAQSGVLGDLFRGVLGGSSSYQNGAYEERIRIAYQRGEISRSEASDLQRWYYDLRRREQQYRQDGLSRDERYDLQRRYSDLQRRFELARSNGRYDDHDYDDDDDYDDDNGWRNDGRRCPPGLAKKRNGCLPPGQVGRTGYDYGSRYDQGDRYVWQRDRYGRMVQVDRRTGQIVSVRYR